MKAVVADRSGPAEVLRVAEIERPEPKASEILVRVFAATVTSGDVNLRRMPRWLLAVVGALFGFKAMKIPGVEFAGEVIAVGTDVTGYALGDAVCGTTTGLAYGANAEYVCVPAKPKQGVLLHKPESVSFKDAAAGLVGSMTAMQILARATIGTRTRVLIYGASGSVGSFALQLAKNAGAQVTAVCSASNLELVSSLGADAEVDYRSEDPLASGETYDVILDAVGKLKKSAAGGALREGGKYLSVRAPTKEVAEEAAEALRLIGEKKVKVVIDREFSLDQIVEAHRYVESGRKRGNVIVNPVA